MSEIKLTEKYIQNHMQSVLIGPAKLVVPNFTPNNWYECDLLQVTKTGYMIEYEIKLTKSDFKNDFKKGKTGRVGHYDGDKNWVWDSTEKKHDRLASKDKDGPKSFWYMCPNGLLQVEDIPDYAGLMYFYDGYKVGHVIKKAPQLHRNPVSEDNISRMLRSMYYRYWEVRRKADRAERKVQAGIYAKD